MIQFFKKSGFRLFTHALTVNLPNSGRRATRWLCQFVRDGDEFESTTSSPSPSWEGLIRCSANYVPLTPISFLERAAKVFGKRVAVVHGSLRFTWEETRFRCVKLASALAQLGISHGDVVATLAPNIPAMQELHFAVPMSGAVLCTLNIRHNSTMLSNLLRHSEAKVLFVDYHLLPTAQEAINLLVMANADGIGKPPILVVIPESDEQISSSGGGVGDGGGDHEYETLLGTGEPEFSIRWPRSEWDPISINYTSGTTSQPKGVVYCHRGAYLNAIATFSLHDMNSTMMPPVYLWTVPMFHCNGWCLIWGLAALGGTNICLRKVCPKEIFQIICQHKVTHMGGAPTVLNMILNSSQNKLPHKVALMTGGSPPPPEIIYNIEKLGFRVSHLYGLTEVYGPGTHCLWKPEWDSLPPSEQAKLKARQGVQHLCLEEVDVIDHVTMKSVPADGKTLGEIMFRGNTVMSGYLKDRRATEEAFRDGWFRSGDLAVKHPDNYIELKDRMKDIIISGGENISSVEVETVLYRHPAVLEVAVVGRPDKHWGQTPCAFVKLKQGFEKKIGAEELIGFCRNQMSHYMVPRTIIFEEIPKTSTGKIQKFILAEKAKALGSLF